MVLCFVLMTSVAYFPTTIESYDTITTEYKTFENRDDNRVVVYGDYNNEFEGNKDVTVLKNDYLLDINYRIAAYNGDLSKQIKSKSYIKASNSHPPSSSSHINDPSSFSSGKISPSLKSIFEKVKINAISESRLSIVTFSFKYTSLCKNPL